MRSSRFMSWLVSCLLAAVCCGAVAVPMVDLSPARQPVALGNAGEYWIEANAKSLPAQIISNPDIVWTLTPDRKSVV